MRYIAIAMLATMLTVASPRHAQAAISKVVVSRIDDTRVYVAPGVPQPMFPGKHAGLNITLQVTGRAAGNATSFGRLSVSGMDNLGGALRQLSASVGGQPIEAGDKAMHEIHRDAIGRPVPPKWFDISLRLTELPRQTTVIRLLKGNFQIIAGGRLKQLLVNPQASLGKNIISPVLNKAGLHIKILRSVPAGAYAPGPADDFLILAIRGNKLALKKVKLLSSSNRDIAKGFTFNSQGESVLTSAYQLKRPLRIGDKVELIIAVGQKTRTVPFDFRNIRLP